MTSFKVNVDCIKDGDDFTIGSYLSDLVESEDKVEDMIITVIANTVINKLNEIKNCFVENSLDPLIDEYNKIIEKAKEHIHSEE